MSQQQIVQISTIETTHSPVFVINTAYLVSRSGILNLLQVVIDSIVCLILLQKLVISSKVFFLCFCALCVVLGDYLRHACLHTFRNSWRNIGCRMVFLFHKRHVFNWFNNSFDFEVVFIEHRRRPCVENSRKLLTVQCLHISLQFK